MIKGDKVIFHWMGKARLGVVHYCFAYPTRYVIATHPQPGFTFPFVNCTADQLVPVPNDATPDQIEALLNIL